MRIKKYEFPIKVGGSEFTHYATFLGERMEYSQRFLDQVGEEEALRRFRKMTIKGLPQRLIPRWIKRIFIRRTMKKIYRLIESKPDTQFPWIPSQIADEIVDRMKNKAVNIESKASAVKELRENPDKYKTAVRGSK